uniref:hypothetical protein n=1 Tax=Streptobacillus felis TaxID=1384509 RepID=UPI000A576A47
NISISQLFLYYIPFIIYIVSYLYPTLYVASNKNLFANTLSLYDVNSSNLFHTLYGYINHNECIIPHFISLNSNSVNFNNTLECATIRLCIDCINLEEANLIAGGNLPT